jgi:hypothetical protein
MSFIINLVVAILSLSAAWVNLIHNKISRFGFDAWLLAIGSLMDAKQVRKVRRDIRLIKRMGIMMLLLGAGAFYGALRSFIEIF